MVASKQCLYALDGTADDRCLSPVERTKNLKEKWHQIQSMQTPRQWFAAVHCNELIYAISGRSGEDAITTTVENFDADQNKWLYLRSMITGRSAHTARVINGKIFVVGGFDASKNAVTIIKCNDSLTETWSVNAYTNIPLSYHLTVVL